MTSKPDPSLLLAWKATVEARDAVPYDVDKLVRQRKQALRRRPVYRLVSALKRMLHPLQDPRD